MVVGGRVVGTTVGVTVGMSVGSSVGYELGAREGVVVGTSVGGSEGEHASHVLRHTSCTFSLLHLYVLSNARAIIFLLKTWGSDNALRT